MIDSTAQNISAIAQELQAFAEQNGASPRLAIYISLTVEELCCAIVERFPERMGEIYVQATVVMEDDRATLYLRDNAYEFNPLEADTEGIALHDGKHDALMGIRIVQKNAREFYYRRYSGFNTLVIRM